MKVVSIYDSEAEPAFSVISLWEIGVKLSIDEKFDDYPVRRIW